MSSWFAGLFYLPRIFVNLTQVPSDSHAERERLLLMARKLYRFASLLMVVAIVPRASCWSRCEPGVLHGQYWLHAKLLLVVVAIGYHHMCRGMLRSFEKLENRRRERWFRVFNEMAVLLFAAIVVLVVVQPVLSDGAAGSTMARPARAPARIPRLPAERARASARELRADADHRLHRTRDLREPVPVQRLVLAGGPAAVGAAGAALAALPRRLRRLVQLRRLHAAGRAGVRQRAAARAPAARGRADRAACCPSVLSWAMEFTQHFLPGRYSSLMDWALNSLGAAAGVSLAVAVHSAGAGVRWSTLRERWFVPRSGATIALLVLWPVGFLYPRNVPFGLGITWERLQEAAYDLLSDHPLAPWFDWLWASLGENTGTMSKAAEGFAVALGLLGPCLVAFAITRPRLAPRGAGAGRGRRSGWRPTRCRPRSTSGRCTRSAG